MLAVINKYKLFLIIITLVLLAVLIWLIVAGQGEKGDPARGVFVVSHFRLFYNITGR